MQMLVLKRGTIVLVNMDELAVFQNGLDFEEQTKVANGEEEIVAMSKTGKRPPLGKVISSPI